MIVWPKQIIDSIARRKAVLIIGSGVSANAKSAEGKSPPTWREFLQAALDRLSDKPKYVKSAINSGNYLHACEYLKKAHGNSWNTLLREHFLDPLYKPADIHKYILELDSRIVVSLNFDVIYDNYALANTEGTYFVKKYSDDDLGQIISGSDRYLIKAHGSIDAPKGLIFTAKDYAEARTKHAPFYRILDSLLVLNTVIMIGCGLSDPDLQFLFENNKFVFDSNAHFVILPSGMSVEEKELYRETRGITILEYKKKGSDHSDLTQSLAFLGSLVESKRQDLASTLDW